jgi:hypothetical protein
MSTMFRHLPAITTQPLLTISHPASLDSSLSHIPTPSDEPPVSAKKSVHWQLPGDPPKLADDCPRGTSVSSRRKGRYGWNSVMNEQPFTATSTAEQYTADVSTTPILPSRTLDVPKVKKGRVHTLATTPSKADTEYYSNVAPLYLILDSYTLQDETEESEDELATPDDNTVEEKDEEVPGGFKSLWNRFSSKKSKRHDTKNQQLPAWTCDKETEKLFW